ncbi:Trk system potassium transporter TrkA [Elongatibacter sediminis]|uniref:Trk system potassium uptake protein TrkA n=1 Tax=Elongatibacter sediminis TaxID=3119006 RepID=A0AAW9RPE5_9GAMM
MTFETMKILILGAGQVGKTVARALSHERSDVTIIDKDPKTLQDMEGRLDVKTILGHASHPDVLIRAGAEDTELILAVTDSDETNMVACQVAYTLFHIPTRLARVRSSSYQRHSELFGHEAVPIDFLINPETLLVNSIKHLIEQSEALQILDFADGLVQLVAVKAHSGGPLVGHELRSLSQKIPNVATRIVAVYRHDQAIVVSGATVIEDDDEVFFLAATPDIPAVLAAFGRSSKPAKRVIIVGGGRVGERLARSIENNHLAKIVERDYERCRDLSRMLYQCIVLNGDATDASLLRDEAVGDTDVFCAVTDDDETNILAAMLAKRYGVGKTLSIINHPDYLDLLRGGAVDIAISPALFTISAILAHIRKGDVMAVHSLRRGAAEAIEIIAHGDKTSSRVVGRKAKQLPLPSGTAIGAIVREGTLLFINSETVIRTDDHIILFVPDKRDIPDVERLFQVKSVFL